MAGHGIFDFSTNVNNPLNTRYAFANAALGGTEHLCPGCRTAPPVFRQARAALRYDAQ